MSTTSAGSTVARVLALVAAALAISLVTVWIVGEDERVVTAPAASTDGYQLWAERLDGSAVRWDPCRSIDWVLDDHAAPDGATEMVAEAFERVGAVTGLRFRYLGTTDERPTRNRTTIDPDRYGSSRWSPVLVSWASPDGSTPLRTSDQALAIPVAVDGVFVTGQIILNADIWLSPDFSERSVSWGGALVHEAGHLVGLDHIDDPDQVMYAFSGHGPIRFGQGDLAGFSAVGVLAGDGACLDAGSPRAIDVEVRDRR